MTASHVFIKIIILFSIVPAEAVDGLKPNIKTASLNSEHLQFAHETFSPCIVEIRWNQK